MNPERIQTLTERLLTVLTTHHQGSANGISAAHLAATIGCCTRDLRLTVKAAREAGTYIAATPDAGYYMPCTEEEIKHASALLYGRAMASLKQVAAMTRQALPAVLKQMELSV